MEEPFQNSASGYVVESEPSPWPPTASQFVAEAHLTALRTLSVEPGLYTTRLCHEVPFHFQAAASAESFWPTARQKLAAVQATPSRAFDSGGVAMAVQAVPFQSRASLPTDRHPFDDQHDTDASGPAPDGTLVVVQPPEASAGPALSTAKETAANKTVRGFFADIRTKL
jgi:hypothetical protein